MSTGIVNAAAAASPIASPNKRDGFLDALRAIALGRVIVWHATGEPVVSWFISTMPIMFFVAGTLLHGSLERRSAPLVLRRRLKRLLVPYWLFGGLVLGFLALVHLQRATDQTALAAHQLIWWIIPLRDPTASAFEAGWASSPLWYLRAYLWLLLLSPLLLKAWNRFGLAALVPPVALMLAAHAWTTANPAGPGDLVWVVGDLGIYAFFLMLGFAQNSGRLAKLRNRDFAEWGLVFAAVTAVAWRLAPSADGVVNHSYPALWAIGLMWLCVFFLLRPALSRSLDTPYVGGLVAWSSRRAMSIYLWHSPAIVGAHWLLTRLGASTGIVPVITFTLVLVFFATLATGWIEDVAGGKAPELWPVRPRTQTPPTVAGLLDAVRGRVQGRGIAAFAGGTLMALLASSMFVTATAAVPAPATAASWTDSAVGSSGGLALPPPPSGRPNPQAGVRASIEVSSGGLALPPAPSGRPDPAAGQVAPRSTAPAADVADLPRPAAALSDTLAAQDLNAIVDAWRVERNVDGVNITLTTGTKAPQLLTAGSQAGGEPLSDSDIVPITSITKTMTASIILQLVDEGLLQLNQPVSLNAVPDFNTDRTITVRQLLNHSSGLVPYQSAAAYNPAVSLTPGEAVTMAARTPLEWTPGAAGGYSNSGYLTLGLLIEQVTGRSYQQVLDERILTPFRLADTSINTTPTGGWVGGSAGGAVSSLADMTRWGHALYRTNEVLSPPMYAEMMAVDAALSSGLGAFPVCPCEAQPGGLLSYTSIGHNGGSVSMQYAPATDTLIVASFTESFWTQELTQHDIYSLFADLRAAS